MGHTNSTPNLSLPQFIGSDKPTWLSDVNGAMLAIDTAYGEIEAQASSASTAAAGAVTAASAAQTAADAAATAAATAGTNASEALSTANNAATVSLNAQTIAENTAEIVNGKVLASVTSDGVKTFAQLLDDLLSLVGVNDIRPGSMFKYGPYFYSLTYLSAAEITFTRTTAELSYSRVDVVSMRTSGSLHIWSVAEASGNTITDKSSEVLTSGFELAIYQ